MSDEVITLINCARRSYQMPEPGAKAPALLVDAMLGNLARRLRWLGYDTEYPQRSA